MRLTAQRCRFIRHTTLRLSASRPTNTSRAYWELKAEQVMDRVFANAGRSEPTTLHAPPPPPPAASEEPIDVEVRDTSRHGPRSWPQAWARPWQIAAASVACLTLIGGFSLWQSWSEARNDLRQERNLRILEGIRSLGAAPDSSGTSTAPSTTDNEVLPPPPPSEPWIEELGQLEARSPGGVAPLQVPLNGTLQAPAPAATLPVAPAAGTTPELLGVVQIPGKPGSAIFQVGGSSTNALVGESIGGSGWRLVSTSGDSAVIERGGTSRRVSISSGF